MSMPVRQQRAATRVLSTYKRSINLNSREDDVCNAFISRTPSGRARVDGKEVAGGSLDGVRVSVKDLFCTTESTTTCASRMLADYTSPFEATVVKKIKSAGGDIVGKTNMDEFGMGSHSTYSHFGEVLNPLGFRHDRHGRPVGDAVQRLSSGGSSGGAAASVASSLCDLAIASDTGGSTRLPAAWTGLVGFKPSYGLVSRWGMVQYATSLDCVGFIARDVSLIRTAFRTVEGFDRLDPTSIPSDLRSLPSHTPPQPLRIGIPLQAFPPSLHSSTLPALRSALRRLKLDPSLKAELKPVSVPQMGEAALSAYYVLASAEAASNLAKFDGVRYGFRAEEDVPGGKGKTPSRMYAATRTQGFGDEVKRRILLGTYALTADAFDNFFLQAQKVRLLLRKSFDRLFRLPSPLVSPPPSTSPFPPTDSTIASSPAVMRQTPKEEGIDLLILPTSLSPAPSLPTPTSQHDPDASTKITEAWSQDTLLVPASLAGLPAITVPFFPPPTSSSDPESFSSRRPEGWTGGEEADRRPVGIQLVGQWGDDERVLAVAESLMQSM